MKTDFTLNPDQIRQGDVFLWRRDKKPDGLVAIKTDTPKRATVALGERTGHMHNIHGNVACFKRHDAEYDAAFGLYDHVIITGGSGVIKHEHNDGRAAEHHAIPVGDGIYEQAQQVEYSPAELVRESD